MLNGILKNGVQKEKYFWLPWLRPPYWIFVYHFQNAKAQQPLEVNTQKCKHFVE
jgi:hypothetical protein